MVRNKKECTYEFPIGCEVLIVKVAREKRVIETDRILEVVIKESGIVTLPEEESATLQNETQYVISGATLSHPIDRKEEARGNMIDSILRMPIWRV